MLELLLQHYEKNNYRALQLPHTKSPTSCSPAIPMQITFFQVLQNFANVLMYAMLKLILVIINFNDKLFITDRIINNK